MSLNYFGIELWAQSAGYLSEASSEFVASDTDHQYVKRDDDAASDGTPSADDAIG